MSKVEKTKENKKIEQIEIVEVLEKYNFVDGKNDEDYDKICNSPKSGMYMIISDVQLISHNMDLLVDKIVESKNKKFFRDDEAKIKFLFKNKKTRFEIKAGISSSNKRGVYNRVYEYKDGLYNEIPHILYIIQKDNIFKPLLFSWECVFRQKILQNNIAVLCKGTNEKYMLIGRDMLDKFIAFGSEIADKIFNKSVNNVISSKDLYDKINNDTIFDIKKKYGKINMRGINNKHEFIKVKKILENKIGEEHSKVEWEIISVKQDQKGIRGNWPSYVLLIRITEGQYDHDKDEIYKIYYSSQDAKKDIFNETTNAGLLRNYLDKKSVCVFINKKHRQTYRGEYMIKNIALTKDKKHAVFELVMDDKTAKFWIEKGEMIDKNIHDCVIKNYKADKTNDVDESSNISEIIDTSESNEVIESDDEEIESNESQIESKIEIKNKKNMKNVKNTKILTDRKIKVVKTPQIKNKNSNTHNVNTKKKQQ